MPTFSQVTSRIEHEAGESNLSMSSERGSFIEKDVHSSASVADEDLRKCQDTLRNILQYVLVHILYITRAASMQSHYIISQYKFGNHLSTHIT